MQKMFKLLGLGFLLVNAATFTSDGVYAESEEMIQKRIRLQGKQHQMQL